MASSWRIQVFENQQLVHKVEFPAGRLELGRQQEMEEGPFSYQPKADPPRMIIARLDDTSTSRHHALIQPIEDNRILIKNTSSLLTVGLTMGRELTPGNSCELQMPVLLTLGNLSVRVQDASTHEEQILQSLAEATVPPGRIVASYSDLPTLTAAPPEVGMQHMVQWFKATMDVLHSAAGAEDFFDKATRAVVELVGLDSGRVLLLRDNQWVKVAAHSTRPDHLVHWEPSMKMLEKVRQQKRTLWLGQQLAYESPSQADMELIVAAPILDRTGAVLGVLYGDRRGGATKWSRPFQQLEASLVELLASGVATGLARLEQEKRFTALRVQFEQFFTPQLARELIDQANLLEGRISEITVFFCDIRNYSRISRRLGPSETLAWLRNVLGVVSECVLTENGVLVDYIGDAVMAMWGAPQPLIDHANRACRTALAILAELPRLNERWSSSLGEPIRLSIGINTGEALVGNTGSKQKFKYGPLGNTVNLASRVEGATKYFKTDLLVTEATHRYLEPSFFSRRLGTISAVNIEDPVTLYELVRERADWKEIKGQYEKALLDFEACRFGSAALGLAKLREEHSDDGPSLVLLSRAVNCLVEEPNPFDPIWHLPGK